MYGEDRGSFGQRAKRTLTRLLVGVLLLGLAGAVVFLLSHLNSRTFTLEVRDGKLVVMKGRMMPVGVQPFLPGEAALADAYAPVPVEAPVPPELTGRKFSERDELDRALFTYFELIARPAVQSDDPAVLDRGLYALRRAERLGGLTEEQRLTLKALQAEVSFYQARSRLEDTRKQLSESLGQLKLAAESKNRNARAANQMILAIEPAAKQLEEALRKAVHDLSSPAPAPAEPAPLAPASVDAAAPDASVPVP